MAQTVAENIIETLIALGVKRIYGIAGDSLNAFTETIRKNEKIIWIPVRHEEVAAFAAGAEAQLTGSLAVCAGSCGPGNLHLINGLYDCHGSGVPILAIAAHIPTIEIGSNYFQETHPEILFQECSVFCELLSQPQQTNRMLEIAIQRALALSDASVIVIPGDISWKKTDAAPRQMWFMDKPFIRPSEQAIETVANLLNQSEKVTIFGGIGCAGSNEVLIHVADLLKAPIVYTLRGKEHLEYNPFSIGLTGLLGYPAGYDALKECDTLLMLGTDFPYRQFYPESAKIIQVDCRAENIGRRTHVDYGLVGNVKETLIALSDKLQMKQNTDFLDDALKNYKQNRLDFSQEAVETEDNQPLHPQFVAKMINDLADDDAIFTCDVGTPTIWAARFLKMNGQRKLLGSFKHGSMANALPQAIGAQLVYPEKQVITLSGDGGIAMLLGDLLTLKQLNLPIKIVVFNNSSFGLVELEMKAAGLLEYATELKNPSFARIAEAIGFIGIRVSSASKLSEAFQEAFAHRKTALIEVIVEREELALPPRIMAEEVLGFSLYMIKAVLNGKTDQLVELVKTNIFR